MFTLWKLLFLWKIFKNLHILCLAADMVETKGKLGAGKFRWIGSTWMVTNNKLTESYNIQIMLLTNELDIQCLLGARNQVIHANQCNAMQCKSFVVKLDRVRRLSNLEVLVVSLEPTWAKVAPIRFNKHEIACRQPWKDKMKDWR